jgi:hypothetical protein
MHGRTAVKVLKKLAVFCGGQRRGRQRTYQAGGPAGDGRVRLPMVAHVMLRARGRTYLSSKTSMLGPAESRWHLSSSRRQRRSVSGRAFMRSGSTSSFMLTASSVHPHRRQCSRARGRQQRRSNSSAAALRLNGRHRMSLRGESTASASHRAPARRPAGLPRDKPRKRRRTNLTKREPGAAGWSVGTTSAPSLAGLPPATPQETRACSLAAASSVGTAADVDCGCATAPPLRLTPHPMAPRSECEGANAFRVHGPMC